MSSPNVRPSEAQLAEICAATPTSSGQQRLLSALSEVLGGVEVALRLTRGGWFRLGGLLDSENQTIEPDFDAWLTRVLEELDWDLEAWFDQYQDSRLRVSRYIGKSHYLIARTGSGPLDFVQLEVEETWEVLDRELIQGDRAPEDLDEILDPPDYTRLPRVRLREPAYQLRRVTWMDDFSQRMALQNPAQSKQFKRFLSEWDASSAAQAGRLDQHFAFRISEHKDRYGDPLPKLTPIFAKEELVESLRVVAEAGSEVANQVHGFDRRAGYPFAWYFALITTGKVPFALAETVYKDHQGDFQYLPERDLALVERWVYQSYALSGL